jgi:hypothetical protein
MAFGDLIKKVSDVASGSNEKLAGVLEEYRRAISALEVFGLRVGKLRVVAGVLPEVSTTIVGSIEYLDPERIRQVMDENPDKRVLTSILSTLLTATSIRESVELNALKAVKVDIVLGIPPKISVDLE